jgi:hypothetical protein
MAKMFTTCSWQTYCRPDRFQKSNIKLTPFAAQQKKPVLKMPLAWLTVNEFYYTWWWQIIISQTKKCNIMDRLNLAGQNLGGVFNFRHRRVFVPCTSFMTEKLSSIKWKTQSNGKQSTVNKSLDGSMYPG